MESHEILDDAVEGTGVKFGSRKHRGTVRDRRPEPWHVDRGLPIAVVFFLIIQAGTLIFWEGHKDAEHEAYERETDRRILTLETFANSVNAELKPLGEDVAVLKDRSTYQINMLDKIADNLKIKR